MASIRPRLGSIVIAESVSMKNHSSFYTGGNAEYYAEPRSIEECLNVLEIAYKKNLNVTVIGSGTHILVSEKGIPGLVICTSSIKGITIKGNLVEAAPGEPLDNIINQAIDHNLIGLEELGGIPGTIGGAVSVNASSNGRSISDVFFYADYLSFDGRYFRRPFYHDYFRKQQSSFGIDGIIVSIALQLNPSRASAEARRRKEKYVELMFIPPCRRFSGEIFKDPEGMSAESVIRRLDIKGRGKASFSDYQPNSIFTLPGCTSAEIHDLITEAE
ncbi:MAG: FAD-binding protein, partial [Spirochaetes bacterium]|nr:FAD-binding protein [Candidatus Ornithospirochaeta stercoravium]